ncbi:dTMP kinase [Paractinoplanes brasiliensis]|uniref:Thymidylate kinase n=1 Tax=Paractinoplanes brasiliensis TaxID=52695 RepID=A0A4R6JUE5_9ACTN|nr:AAA family ATPase [Actinoplanes brasiliensis]TDO38275.1 thymidylate kinase [Actinoplanes brasiliensis]GID26949.1 thymidylate kinase [Actinoplanes brasiliensis]
MTHGRVPAPGMIALVGIDGSGKTTQAHRLARELSAAGVRAAYRRNAGGRHWFGRLARLFGKSDGDALLGRRGMLAVESVLRWLAILRTLLRRAVTGGTVVMDRYAFCQYASLRARSAKPAAERRARLAYRLFRAPDVTFFLDVDPQVARDRIDARGYDSETLDYLAAARAAYYSLPEFATFVVIDANGTPDQVSAAIHAHLAGRAAPDPGHSVRSMIVAGGPLVAALAVAGEQFTETL